MNEEKIFLTVEQAIKLLPDCDEIHTLLHSGNCLIGSDHSREWIIEQLKKAPFIEVTGPAAQSIGHGIGIEKPLGWLFIKARQFQSQA